MRDAVRHQGCHRQLEIAPGILAPGIILVDAGNTLDLVFHLGRDIARCRDVVRGRMVDGTEYVFGIFINFLEHARCAANRLNRQNLQFFGNRGRRSTCAGRDNADDRIDIVFLNLVAHLGDLLGTAAGFVIDQRFNLTTGKTLGVVGGGQFAVIDTANDQFRAVLCRNAECRCCSTGEKRRRTDFNGLRECRTAAKRNSACD